jgi:diguanylate cyclase
VAADALEDTDFDYAMSIARKAMDLMAKHRVPPTPDNFSVWFTYVLGTSIELKRAIDIVIGNKRRFDAKTNHDLFVAYVGLQASDGRTINYASQRLRSLMVSARQFLNTAIADNHSQIQAISGVADRGGAELNSRQLIESLMKELEKATTRATHLETNFAEKARELDSIRDSLSKSEERAKTDTLTGLPNRRGLEEFFRVAQIAAMEKGEPLSVLLIDVDHFKKFNDNFGHAVGDQVLQLMATVLRDKVRDGDLPARYGGEELIAVLPKADLAACQRVAERIRRAIAECSIAGRTASEVLPRVTTSIGVAQFQPGESMSDLIDRCDRALYLAKKAGRNRVVTENELPCDLAAAG